MGTGLVGITDAMKESEITGIIDGSKELQGRMETCEAIAHRKPPQGRAVGTCIGADGGSGFGEVSEA